jgi:mono/diheme cytochrome c family protein
MHILKLVLISLLSVYTSLSITACQQGTSQNNGRLGESEMANGEKIYLQYCKMCHGVDGTLGLNGAANLKKSTLTNTQAIDIVKEGRNTMQPYRELLNEEEIEAVATYAMKLKE